MRKTTLTVNDELVAQAGAVLGTRGLKATIDRALEEVVALAARRVAVQQLMEMRGLELDQPDVMAAAWR